MENRYPKETRVSQNGETKTQKCTYFMTIERAHPLITKRAVINIEWDVKRLRFTGHTKDTKYYCGANDEDFFSDTSNVDRYYTRAFAM